MAIETFVQDGRNRVVMDRSDYQDLIDARDHAIAMRGIAAGEPTIPDAELGAYLAAPHPLAYWRGKAGLTQAALAEAADVPHDDVGQIEAGLREGTVGVLAKLARVLGLRIEDLVAD